MSSEDILLVAGEASGDLHGARLLSELRKLRPQLRAFGLGGDELHAAGFDRICHSSDISVVGITEVLTILARARRIFATLLREAERREASAAILIDFPDFNLRLAKALKKRGLTVIYYISPQVWAWRQGRVKTISKVVDDMLVLLPFEVDFYKGHGIEAIHVGHPLVDEVPSLPQVWDQPRSDERFHIALLPGSRRSEVRVLLPILLEAARRLRKRLPCRFSLIRAASLSQDEIAARASTVDDLEIVSTDRFATLATCHLALCAAGTATLEVGLLGTPMIVTHRVGGWTYRLGRLLVDLPYASLVNLLLDREAVPELLQWKARPDTLCEEAVALLGDEDRLGRIRRDLGELRQRIGPPGASRRAALEIIRRLEGPDAPLPTPAAAKEQQRDPF